MGPDAEESGGAVVTPAGAVTRRWAEKLCRRCRCCHQQRSDTEIGPGPYPTPRPWGGGGGRVESYIALRLQTDLALGSVRATSARRRQIPGPASPIARSGVRIWRAEPIDARHGRAALLERGVAAVDPPAMAGAVIRAPTAVSTSTRGGRGQG